MEQRVYFRVRRYLFYVYYALLVSLPSAAIHYYGASGMTAGLFTTAFLVAAIIIRPFMGL